MLLNKIKSFVMKEWNIGAHLDGLLNNIRFKLMDCNEIEGCVDSLLSPELIDEVLWENYRHNLVIEQISKEGKGRWCVAGKDSEKDYFLKDLADLKNEIERRDMPVNNDYSEKINKIVKSFVLCDLFIHKFNCPKTMRDLENNVDFVKEYIPVDKDNLIKEVGTLYSKKSVSEYLEYLDISDESLLEMNLVPEELINEFESIMHNEIVNVYLNGGGAEIFEKINTRLSDYNNFVKENIYNVQDNMYHNSHIAARNFVGAAVKYELGNDSQKQFLYSTLESAKKTLDDAFKEYNLFSLKYGAILEEDEFTLKENVDMVLESINLSIDYYIHCANPFKYVIVNPNKFNTIEY